MEGYNFTRYTQPVVRPPKAYETRRTEDPRVIRVIGTFYVICTEFKGRTSRVCLAQSTNLLYWKKLGPLLPDCTDVEYRFGESVNDHCPHEGWSKSGAIIPDKINGLYAMRWGDSFLMSANSMKLIHWNYNCNDQPFAQKLNIWGQGLVKYATPL